MKLLMITLLASTSWVVSACNQNQTAPEPEIEAAEIVEEITAPETLSADIYPGPEKTPNYGPAYGSLTFVDVDPSATIGGTLTMGRAIDDTGNRLDESSEGIGKYMIHWGLEVGAPGTADDKHAGDLGGDCRGFRDTGHVVMIDTADLGDNDTLSWNIPIGTEVPEGAVYFVGHTIYGVIHNLGKCTQTPIINLVE